MRSQFLGGKLLLSLFVMMILGAAIARGERATEWWAANAPRQTDSSGSKHRPEFDCLPKDVQLKDVVTYGGTAKENVTVQKKLVEMKAKCRGDKLVNSKRREIRFFRVSCWGNPPMNYREIQKRQNEQLEKLQRLYAVIVFSCNPMIQ